MLPVLFLHTSIGAILRRRNFLDNQFSASISEKYKKIHVTIWMRFIDGILVHPKVRSITFFSPLGLMFLTTTTNLEQNGNRYIQSFTHVNLSHFNQMFKIYFTTYLLKKVRNWSRGKQVCQWIWYALLSLIRFNTVWTWANRSSTVSARPSSITFM